MKRTDYITIMLCLLAVVVMVVVARCPRTVPLHKCSEVYQRYVGHEGIEAAYIQDFPINDTLTIAVTLLQATTDSGWALLQKDFAITPILPEVAALIDSTSVAFWLASKKDYSMRMDTIPSNNDFVAASFFHHRVAIFNIESENQKEAIINYQVKSTSSNTSKK